MTTFFDTNIIPSDHINSVRQYKTLDLTEIKDTLKHRKLLRKRWCEEKDIDRVTLTLYCPDNNQVAESCVKRVKFAIEDTLNANMHLKIRDYEIQSFIHNLAQEMMQGALATPHQARYLALGQDDKIEVYPTHR